MMRSVGQVGNALAAILDLIGKMQLSKNNSLKLGSPRRTCLRGEPVEAFTVVRCPWADETTKSDALALINEAAVRSFSWLW